MKDYDRNREGSKLSKAIGTEASQVSEQNPSGSTLISLEDITLISDISPGYSLSNDCDRKLSALSTAKSYSQIFPSERLTLLLSALE